MAALARLARAREGWPHAGIYVMVAVAVLHRGRSGVRAPAGGEHRCPGCGERHRAPLLGLNLVLRRFERCPHCRRWHFV